MFLVILLFGGCRHSSALAARLLLLPAGDYFGELALLPGGNTRAATVRARTDVSLLVLDRTNFENLLGPLMPQLQAASKNYTGYKPKAGIQVGMSALSGSIGFCGRNRCPLPVTGFCVTNQPPQPTSQGQSQIWMAVVDTTPHRVC